MNFNRRINLRSVGAAVACLAVVLGGVTVWMRWADNQRFSDVRSLLARFPVEDSMVLRVDFAAIRAGGLLPPSQAPLEADYKQFLDATGFDYRKDLDSVVASFSASGNFYIARGRFDWKKLRDYAAHQGGSCYQDLCRMQGSTPQRRISFLPLRDDTIALAVSTDDLAANRLTKAGEAIKAEIPSAPVWLSVPGSALARQGVFPSGLGLMLSALTHADRLVVTMGAAGDALSAKMEATCRTNDDARLLASQLRNMTATLKEAVQRDPQAQADDLARLLVGGTFDDSGSRVHGQWPVTRSLLASLTSGI